jgi:hypothetical protein
VLEHELTATRFHYVMPYVPGDDLSVETARLHAAAGSASSDGRGAATGLDEAGLRRVMSLSDDLLSTLERFHRSGLWHKDVKPSNIIVSGGRAHLVDFGLITPLRSAMTLTTHGTEYFRDPEMVRLALRGVKVHEVDGIKFDVYGAGAVLYSLIENSFPAHGSLSRLTRRCPEALRWVMRRAMADMGNRYASATEMLGDLRTVSTAADPFAVRPADLPSLQGRPRVAEALVDAQRDAQADLSGSGGTAATSRMPGAPAGDIALPAADAREPGPLPAADAPPRREEPSRALPLSRPRRRTSKKAVAAMLILGLVLAQLLFHGDSDSDGERRTAAGAEPDEGPLVSSIEGAGARRAAGDASERDADGVHAVGHATDGDSPLTMLEPVSLDRLPRDDGAVLSPPLPQPPLGTVLVLDDLPATAEPARVQAVQESCARLRAARYALLGVAAPDGPATTTASDPAAEIELLAGARSAVGLSDPSDADAVERLSDYLAAQGESLDAIYWIGRADDGAPAHTRVITRSEAIARAISKVLAARRL